VKSNLKIALITEYTEIGGGESNLLNLTEELNKVNDVTIFCSGKVRSEANKRGIKTIDFKTGRRWIKFISIVSLDGDLKQQLNQFDIVHVYSVNVLPCLIGVKSKIVWTTHGFWEKPNGLRGKIIDKIVDKVVCVSTDVFNIADFKSSKKQTIFLGTNFKILKTAQDKVFEHTNVNLVCIGRFQKIKGQDILIDALEKLSKRHGEINFNLSIVGDVNGHNQEDIDYKKLLQDKVKNTDNTNLKIKFEGFQTDVRSYIENADIVVIPSRYESFSMVAIEALSCGKPVIAPNIGGPKDIIDSDVVGMLFEAENVDSLSESIIKTIENFSNFNTEEALKRARIFSIENQAKQHVTLYKEVLNG
jgi:glycosyltransferase involved in cell wall biosynthesis